MILTLDPLSQAALGAAHPHKVSEPGAKPGPAPTLAVPAVGLGAAGSSPFPTPAAPVSFKVVCGWCGLHMRGPLTGSRISHGMCERCGATAKEQALSMRIAA